MNRQLQTTSFNLKNIFHGKIKSFFTRGFSSPPKEHLTDKSQPQIKTDQVDQIDLSRQTFATGDAAVPAKPAPFLPDDEAVNDFFNSIQLEQVKHELHKWFFFGLAGEGQQIADLTPRQVAYFKNELPELISALYNYHRSRRKETRDEL